MRYALILLMLLPGLALGAESLGRLFTTPVERANLDHLRQTRKIEPINIEQPETVTEEAPVTPPEISVQGYVKRSDGKAGTVWVNDEPLQESSSTSGVEVGKLPKSGNQVQIKVPGLDKSLKLKPGQAYVPETDSIAEDKARIMADPQSSESATENP